MRKKLIRSLLYAFASFIVLAFLLPYWVAAILTVNVFLISYVLIKPSPTEKEEEPLTKEISDSEMMEASGRNILKNIDLYCHRIQGEHVKTLLKEIIVISYKIIQEMDEDNDRHRHIREFVVYYLPALEKITGKYMEYESQNIQSKDRLTFLESYPKSLEDTRYAFASLLEQLYKDDIDDAIIEMEALKASLKAKGLLEQTEGQ